MSTSSKVASTAEEIASIQELMSDLERRLHRLSGATKREFSGASGEIHDFVNDALPESWTACAMARIRFHIRWRIKRRTSAAMRSRKSPMRWRNAR